MKEPLLPYIHGFPLLNRERNIAYALSRQRERAMEIFDRRTADGEPLTAEDLGPDNFADDLEHYADLIETLMHHGTRGFYQAGCRCDWCDKANKQYWDRSNKTRNTRFKFKLSILEDAL